VATITNSQASLVAGQSAVAGMTVPLASMTVPLARAVLLVRAARMSQAPPNWPPGSALPGSSPPPTRRRWPGWTQAGRIPKTIPVTGPPTRLAAMASWPIWTR
jgi:hypothetical protein